MSKERLIALVEEAESLLKQEAPVDPTKADEVTQEIERLTKQHPSVVSGRRLMAVYTGLEQRLLSEEEEDGDA